MDKPTIDVYFRIHTDGTQKLDCILNGAELSDEVKLLLTSGAEKVFLRNTDEHPAYRRIVDFAMLSRNPNSKNKDDPLKPYRIIIYKEQ